MKFGYVIVYVPDVPAAVAFYERAFGLPRRFLHEGGQYAEMETGGTALAFASEELVSSTAHDFRRNRLGESPAGVEIAFQTDDVPGAYAAAIAAGARAHVEPVAKPWGQVVAYVRDLNGVLVEICSAHDAAA